MDKVESGQAASFSPMNGNYRRHVPADFKAKRQVNTNHGEIWSDFDFKLAAGRYHPADNTSDGKFRRSPWYRSAMTGTINAGAPKPTFHTFNGKDLHPRKKEINSDGRGRIGAANTRQGAVS